MFRGTESVGGTFILVYKSNRKKNPDLETFLPIDRRFFFFGLIVSLVEWYIVVVVRVVHTMDRTATWVMCLPRTIVY